LVIEESKINGSSLKSRKLVVEVSKINGSSSKAKVRYSGRRALEHFGLKTTAVHANFLSAKEKVPNRSN
jgi:hypothetical protein